MQTEDLREQLRQYLLKQQERRSRVDSPRSDWAEENQLEHAARSSTRNNLAALLMNSAAQIGTIDGKMANAKPIEDFARSQNAANDQYRGMIDKQETDRDKRSEKTLQLYRYLSEKGAGASGTKRKLADSLLSPKGDPVLLDEEGNPQSLPGYRLMPKLPAQFWAPSPQGTWRSEIDGEGVPYQTNSLTGDIRQPELPKTFTPKTSPSPREKLPSQTKTEKKAAAAPPVRLTDTQRNAAMFHNNAEGALKILEKMEDEGYRPDWKTGAKETLVPDAFKGYAFDAKEQAYRQAAMDFTAAKLRLESGASIPKEEVESQAQIYMVRPGDSPQVIAQKRAARKQAMSGLKIKAGDALKVGNQGGASIIDEMSDAEVDAALKARGLAP